MNWLTKRGVVLLAAGAVVGVGSGLLWPGSVAEGDPITFTHWVAIAGFLLTAGLLITAAISIFLAMVGSAWEVKDFDLNKYLENMKRKK